MKTPAPLNIKNHSSLFPILLLLMTLLLFGCENIQTTAAKSKKEKEENKTEAPKPEAENTNQILCGGTPFDQKLNGFVKLHSGIAYDLADPSTQCSGIFQRFLGSIRESCPETATKTPPASQFDSRLQGKWYHEKQALTRINDPIAQAELIRPGVVMFYGRLSQEFYNTNPIEKYWTREEGIRHLGVVVDVKRDETTNEIQSYSLFHGRRPGTVSGITNADNYMHRRIAKPNAPSFGNGPDPWIGVASVIVKE